MAEPDYYAILGVPRDADGAQIRRAYQRLARRYHPDIHPGDRSAEERFEAVMRAYELLSDPQRRQLYDEGVSAVGGAEGATRGSRPMAGRLGVVALRIEELVGVVVGREEKPQSGRGLDLETEVNLDFGEAIRGVTTSLSIQREQPCPRCGGQRERLASCPECGQRGVVVELERMRVRLPAGVGPGSRVRLSGKGNRGEGGERGHLYVVTRVRPHPYFRRRGHDIHATVPLTLAEAALGAEVEIPTIDGPVRVKIPPLTPGGQRFRLKGRGVPRPNGSRGDHYYSVQVVMPRHLDERARETLRSMDQDDPRRDLPRQPL